jgi:ribosome-binding protein aMBF1 (putative translation factor)
VWYKLLYSSKAKSRVSKQIIRQGGKPAFVVVPIDEWRRIEAILEDRIDTAAVRDFLRNPSETFPDSVVSAILNGTTPVKAIREHRGLTQVQLARSTGTSAVYLSQIERGERRAGRKLMSKLAKALGVEPDLLDSAPV